MEHTTTQIINEAIDSDVWDEILSPETETILADLTRLSTDYSCHGCAF